METDPQLCAACGASLPTRLADNCAVCGKDPLLQGRYLLIDTVGRGAAGITYRAVEVDSGRRVAIKEMAYRHANSIKALELFEREATVLQQTSHPGIPEYLEHFEAGDGKARALYLVQEFLEGQTLAEESSGRRYTEDEVLGIVDELLEILTYLHALRPRIIHRDLKPENVMRRASDGKLVLIDFGSVRDAVKDPELGGSTVAGTFGYMAPEQFRGVAEPGTDLYAVGALAVNLLTRREPHQMLGPTGSLDWRRHVQVSDGTLSVLNTLLAPDIRNRAADATATRQQVARARGKASGVQGAQVPRRGNAEPAGTHKSDRAQRRAVRRDLRNEPRNQRRLTRGARRSASTDGGKRRRPLFAFAIAAWVLISIFVHAPWVIMVLGILAIVFLPRILSRARDEATAGPSAESEAEQAREAEDDDGGWTLPDSDTDDVDSESAASEESAAEVGTTRSH